MTSPLVEPPDDVLFISNAEESDVFKKCHFTCVYCGFDGRTFDGWMQLSVDHIMPRHLGGDEAPENLVVACRSCNSITNRMTFEPGTSKSEIIRRKQEKVRTRRQDFYDDWLTRAAPYFLERPLPMVYTPASPLAESVAVTPTRASSCDIPEPNFPLESPQCAPLPNPPLNRPPSTGSPS